MPDISVMTEISESNEPLPEAIQQFILHWGDMGNQWGVNRSVAQIHAFLYVSEKPRPSEDIADALNMARSNVSTSIKELLSWKLVRRVPVIRDRRDHFEAETDIWEIVRLIAQGRKTRELDPAAEVLRDCLQASDNTAINSTATARMQEMLTFVEAISSWHEQILTIPKNKLLMLIKMGSKVTRLLSSSDEGRPGDKPGKTE